MSRPFSFTGAVPKMNSVFLVLFQEGFHPENKWYNDILDRADMRFEDFVSSRDKVSEDYDIVGVIVFHSKDEVNIDGHEFSFDRGDIHCLDLELFSNRVVFPDVGSSCCYIGFFDTTISDNSRTVGVGL